MKSKRTRKEIPDVHKTSAGKVKKPKKEQKVFNVKAVLKERGAGEQKEYYLSWQGFPASHNSWSWAEHCNCHDLIIDFYVEKFTREIKDNAKTLRKKHEGTPLDALVLLLEKRALNRLATEAQNAKLMEKTGNEFEELAQDVANQAFRDLIRLSEKTGSPGKRSPIPVESYHAEEIVAKASEEQDDDDGIEEAVEALPPKSPQPARSWLGRLSNLFTAPFTR